MSCKTGQIFWAISRDLFGDYSQVCVGFVTALTRGAEWAATGGVTATIPDDFPSEDEVSLREIVE